LEESSKLCNTKFIKMVKVKVVNLDGRETEYDVEYPKAYIAKIIESQNALVEEVRNVREVYANGKLIAELHGTELRLAQTKKKKEIKPVGCDVGQYLVEKESADKDWLEYEAELAKIRSVDWVTDHTGGNIEITYS